MMEMLIIANQYWAVFSAKYNFC